MSLPLAARAPSWNRWRCSRNASAVAFFGVHYRLLSAVVKPQRDRGERQEEQQPRAYGAQDQDRDAQLQS
jgi:hypothetical protein